MKKMIFKRLAALVTAMVMAIGGLAVLPGETFPDFGIAASASNSYYEEYSYVACGDNCQMSLSNGILTITGFGPMFNITYDDTGNYYDWLYYHNCISASKSFIQEIKIPDTITYIGSDAFSGTDINSIVLPNSLTGIGNSSFCACPSLKNVTIKNAENIGSDAFRFCTELTNISFPENLKYIGYEAFSVCNFSEIEIPDGTIGIDSYAFANNSNLTKIMIPKSVTTFGENVFYDCPNLTIYGYTGSTAETYAGEYDINFVPIDGTADPVDENTLLEHLKQVSGCTQITPLYLDMDNDGKNELVALTVSPDFNDYDNEPWHCSDELWYCSSDMSVCEKVCDTLGMCSLSSITYDDEAHVILNITNAPSNANRAFEILALRNGKLTRIFTGNDYAEVDETGKKVIAYVKNDSISYNETHVYVYDKTTQEYVEESETSDEPEEKEPIEIDIQFLDENGKKLDKIEYKKGIWVQIPTKLVVSITNNTDLEYDNIFINISPWIKIVSISIDDKVVSNDDIVLNANSTKKLEYQIELNDCSAFSREPYMSFEITVYGADENEVTKEKTELKCESDVFSVRNGDYNTEKDEVLSRELLTTYLYVDNQAFSSWYENVSLDGGTCYGFSSTLSTLRYIDGLNKYFSADDNVKNISDITENTKFGEISFKELIRIMHTTQFTVQNQKQMWSNYNNFFTILDEVKHIAPFDMKPMVVGIRNYNIFNIFTDENTYQAHALTPYKVEQAGTPNDYKIYVYDSNKPYSTSYILVNPVAETWSYYIDDDTVWRGGGGLLNSIYLRGFDSQDYMDCIYNKGASFKVNIDSDGYEYSSISTDSDKIVVTDNKDSYVLSYDRNYNDDKIKIYPLLGDGGSDYSDISYFYYLSPNEYSIRNSNNSDYEITYCLSDTAISADLPANAEITLNVSDDSADDTYATVKGSSGDRISLSLEHDTLIDRDFTDIKFDGIMYDTLKIQETDDGMTITGINSGTFEIIATDGTITTKTIADVPEDTTVTAIVYSDNTGDVVFDGQHTHQYGFAWCSDNTSHWHECSCGEKADIASHVSDGGKVTVQPTSTTAGVRTYSCSVCGYVMRTETIPATGSSGGSGGSGGSGDSGGYPTYPSTTTDTTTSTTITTSTVTDKLTVKATTNGDKVTLKWNEIKGAKSYTVYQYKDGKYVKIKETTKTSVTFKSLKNGKTYKFLVKYTKNGKLSSTSKSGKVSVTAYYKPIPKATSTENSVKLKWEAVPEAEKYAVYKYVNGKAVKLAETKKTAVRITKLKSDTEYEYIVRAYVDGEWTTMKKSDIVTVKTN